jgi:antitoxin (DNA-binding transcriptional repressor) of toxin-antitoxin stability system
MQMAYSTTEARQQFEALAIRASLGETFTITRYGKPLARLEPANASAGELRVTNEEEGVTLL